MYTPADTQALAALLDRFRATYGFPGATAAIALPDGRLITTATGLADREHGKVMHPTTPMLAASIGKTFVAAAVLGLEQDGRLSREDRAVKYLGGAPWFDALPNAQRFTIGQLLRHQSGLPDHPHLPAFQRAARGRMANGGAPFSPVELLGFVVGEAALFEPGQGWSYSDTGFILLGLIIEAVAGESYYTHIDKRFLTPLTLAATVPSNRRDIAGLAVGYTPPDNPFALPARTAEENGQLVWEPGTEWTGGGYASTPGDLARWGQALFTGRALPGAYLDVMLDGVTTNPDNALALYGTGVEIYAKGTQGPVYGHAGWIPGYISSLRHYGDHRLSVAFQVNSDAGALDGSSDLMPALEQALAGLAITVSGRD